MDVYTCVSVGRKKVYLEGSIFENIQEFDCIEEQIMAEMMFMEEKYA